jgi:hypothetical protein
MNPGERGPDEDDASVQELRSRLDRSGPALSAACFRLEMCWPRNPWDLCLVDPDAGIWAGDACCQMGLCPTSGWDVRDRCAIVV